MGGFWKVMSRSWKGVRKGSWKGVKLEWSQKAPNRRAKAGKELKIDVGRKYLADAGRGREIML